MAPMVRVSSRRVYLQGWRLHHGAFGILLAVLGTLLAYHDRRDAGLWFRRERLPVTRDGP